MFHVFGRCSFALLFSPTHPLIWAPVVIVRDTLTRTCPLSEHMQTDARVGIALIASVALLSVLVLTRRIE